MISETFEKRWERSISDTSEGGQRYPFIRISKAAHQAIDTGINLLYRSGKFSKLLLLHDSYVFLYSNVLFGEINHTVSSLEETTETDHQWDIICGLFQLGGRIPNSRYDSSVDSMLRSLTLIAENGIGVFFLTSATFRRFDIRSILTDYDIYLQAIIELPLGFLLPATSIPMSIVIVERKYTGHEFIAEIKHLEDLQTIFANYINNKNTGYLETGIVQTPGLQTIPFYRLEEALSDMPSDYQSFPRIPRIFLCVCPCYWYIHSIHIGRIFEE